MVFAGSLASAIGSLARGGGLARHSGLCALGGCLGSAGSLGLAVLGGGMNGFAQDIRRTWLRVCRTAAVGLETVGIAVLRRAR